MLGTLIQSTGMETLKLLLKVAEMQPLREGTTVQDSKETCVLVPMLIVTSDLHEDSHSQQGTLFLWALVPLCVKKNDTWQTHNVQ